MRKRKASNSLSVCKTLIMWNASKQSSTNSVGYRKPVPNFQEPGILILLNDSCVRILMWSKMIFKNGTERTCALFACSAHEAQVQRTAVAVRVPGLCPFSNRSVHFHCGKGSFRARIDFFHIYRPVFRKLRQYIIINTALFVLSEWKQMRKKTHVYSIFRSAYVRC